METQPDVCPILRKPRSSRKMRGCIPREFLAQVMEPLTCGKPALTPNHWAVCGILYTLVLCGSSNFALVASSSGLADGMGGVLGLSKLHRDLIGEGSHRHLTSTMIFNIQPDMMPWFAAHFCEAMVIERLPIGVFADPFELQHLVQRQIYLDAAVFGDTNLELPSALSNRSVVEVHMNFEHGKLSKGGELVLELPLHARYPPLDKTGYSRVEIGAPDLFVRCRPKSSKNDASNWKLIDLNAVSGNNVIWSVPCGDEGRTGFVSVVTFMSALFSAVLLVFSALYFSDGDGI